MKISPVVVLLISLVCLPVQADEIHPSKQFEAMLISCLPGGKKDDNCLSDTLLEFTKNKGLRDKLPNTINGLFNTIIGGRKVYAVHPVTTKTLGDFLVEENIIIENDGGGLMLLRVLFSKSLDVWQVRNVNLSSKKDTMEQALDVKL